MSMVTATSTEKYFGLSTDQKPTENVSNGDCFIEMDRGKIWFFDKENSAWIEWGA